jgi:translocation and assembly module TamB
MSEEQKPVSSDEAKPRKSWGGRIGRGVAWLIGGVLLLLVVLLAGGAWYTTTEDFQHRVGKEVVSVLEDATGGKVDLARITFNLWHLAIEADGLVIHGLEGPGEAPYLSADKIFVRVKIFDFLKRSTGSGQRSYVGLSFLRVEQPHVHLIIDKDGKTNQPVPKHTTPSNEPVTDTLLDLKAEEVELANGLAVMNDKAVPFNLAAQDLQANVHYIASTDRYGATIDLNDLRTQMQKEPEAQSKLHVVAEIGRNSADLKEFTFHSGAASDLSAFAAIKDFNNPVWTATVKGSLELKQISVLAGVDGLDAGSVELNVAGHNCNVEPVAAQQKPQNFLKRLRNRHEAAAAAPKTLPPDPECQKGYLLVGGIKLHDAAYKDQYVSLHDINGGAQLHITPTELLFSALTGRLPGGGSATGELKIENWLGEVPANTPPASPTVQAATTTANKTTTAIVGEARVGAAVAPPVTRAHAYLTVVVDKISLNTITAVTATPQYRNLGFDTSINGPVKVEWGGPVVDIADSVLVDAQLSLKPIGTHGGRDIPVSGAVLGHYDGKTETVQIKRVEANTPRSSLVADGVLGVNAGDPLTALNVDLQVRDLGEYDQLLRTLGLAGNGKKGSAAIPIALHGDAHFHGTAKGAIAKLDVKGHLEANNLEVRLGDFQTVAPPTPQPTNLVAVAMTSSTPVAPVVTSPVTDVHIDSLVADAEYTPAGLAVASSTIKQGTAVLNVSGAFKPRTVYKHKTATYVWDDGTTIDAKVQLADAKMSDVLAIAGQQDRVPVTGTINVNGHVAGTLKTLSGGGSVSLVNGVAYGEPYESVNVDLTAQGQTVEASRVALRLHGMAINGNGGYDLTSKHFHGHIEGDNLQLSKFTTVQKAKVNADGVLTIVADANGTVEQPDLKASVKLTNVVAQGHPIGQAAIEAHSQGKVVYYTAKSTLVGTPVDAEGQTELVGNYQTKAHVTLGTLDVGKALALFQPGGLQATSNITGTIDVSGPAAVPTGLSGKAVFNNFSLTSQGLTFKAAEPLTIGLSNGVATLDKVHVTGPDTDLRMGGTAQVFGAKDPKTGAVDNKSGKLDVQALGSISTTIAQTFDPDLVTSGKVVFSVGAVGTIGNPALTGNVQFQGVNLAVNGVPNGLTNLNGTLVFNQDRLNVQTLTATTGGGQLKIGGFLTYRNGVYADLTASGDAVRVRFNGLSGTANANFRLQGGPQSALLSGNILLTRFGIGADVDFAQFAGAGGVSAPPDPSAATNKIRLDVHVTSSPQLDFQNSYAKIAGTVDLNVRGTVADPSVLGRIQITDGNATFAGVEYQLERGNIYFSNPVRIDPTIDLDATARVENYDITVGVHGTSANFKPTYRSEPPLSEADIFNLLALGRTQEEAQLNNEQQVQAGTDPTTSALLGGALNATVSSRVSKLFGGGGSSVKIDPAFVGTLGNSTARITVQQQLNRQVTLTFATNVNSSAQQLIAFQYEFSPTLSVLAQRDESDVFSVVFKVRRRYR